MLERIALAEETQFSRLLREARKASGLSYRKMAELVPFTHSHLVRMETADRNPPDREGVIQIARALNADVDAMLLAAGYAPEGAIKRPAVIQWPGGVDPRTDDEKRIMADAAAIGLDEFGALSEPGFWDLPPEERRGLFRDIEGAIEETRRIYKQIGKKMPGEKA